jgi:hypothetical protein
MNSNRFGSCPRRLALTVTLVTALLTHGFAVSQAHAQLRLGARVGTIEKAAPVGKEAASGGEASKIGENVKQSYDVLSSNPPHPSTSTLEDLALFAFGVFTVIMLYFKAGRAALAWIGWRR